MKINKTYRKYFTMLPILVLLNSCVFSGKFPLTINDIDTLSIYQKHEDSLAHIIQTSSLNKPKINVITSLKTDNVELSKEKWTICIGVFKVKQNARIKFHELDAKSGAYLIIRGKLHFITTGLFQTRDSASIYKKNNIDVESYLLKTTQNEQFLKSFPDNSE